MSENGSVATNVLVGEFVTVFNCSNTFVPVERSQTMNLTGTAPVVPSQKPKPLISVVCSTLTGWAGPELAPRKVLKLPIPVEINVCALAAEAARKSAAAAAVRRSV